MATKKIKKVETPIDQRETFVSIQKSFADSDISLEEKLRTLYDLQKADTEIDKILHLRGELPAEVDALEVEVAELKDRITGLNELIEGYNRTIAMGKQKIIDCDTQITQYQKQLENITNSREFDSINKEIENQGLERQIAEKQIGEAKVSIAECRAEIEDVKDRITIRTGDLQAKKDELAGIVDSTSKEEARLRSNREKFAAKIDARTMSAYERIRASVHNHLAVVTVYDLEIKNTSAPKSKKASEEKEAEDAMYFEYKGGACGGCFNTVTPQRLVDIMSNRRLVICEHCGRIIVNPNIEETVK